MLTWQLVLWGIGFLGETHGWIVARVADAWGAAASVAAYFVQVGLGIQILVAVLYIAVGVWFAFHRPAVWYDRAAIAVLWLPTFALALGLYLVVVAYTVGIGVAFYAGAIGLALLPYEAVVRGTLSLVR